MIDLAKRKKVVIVDEELTPTVLAIKADKKKTSVFSIVWIVIIFAVFIAGVYYLPELSQYVSNYLNPEIENPGTVNNPNGGNNGNDDDEGVEIVEYKLAEAPEIKEELFTLSNFKIEDNQLSFLVTNTSGSALDLSKFNYFLNLYNDNKRLLQRIMVHDGVVAISGSITLTFDLQEEGITILTFVNISQDAYPVHVITADDSGNATLVCKKENETVNYLLTNNKVYAIQDIFEVPADDPNYSVLYSTYQALSSTYNSVGGVTSSVSVEDNIMYFRTLYNLNTTAENAVNNKIFYVKDTDAKIMKFELEASGYSCN